MSIARLIDTAMSVDEYNDDGALVEW